MKATIKQYEEWVKLEEGCFSGFGRIRRAFEYAKRLGIDEKSNCQACGDFETPDCDDNLCFVCGNYKGEDVEWEYKVDLANHPDPLKIIYKDGFDAGYKSGIHADKKLDSTTPIAKGTQHINREFNSIYNIHLNLQQLEILIQATAALLLQKHNDNLHFKDFENNKKFIDEISTVRDLLLFAEEQERSGN